ncbi:MAG: hypothetical protein JSV04_11125 [Candidatus Heimdallarchaeota archaeon]|nr:MAG: hypothetical protein JSV04_11125 [Candidatus Heimdallarchaeota archaeon]
MTKTFMKICIIGSTALKTRMVDTLIGGPSSETPGLGVNFSTKQLEYNDQVYKLILVDSGGDSFFFTTRYKWILKHGGVKPVFYTGAHACIITFDKGVEASFEVVSDWYKGARKSIPDPRIPIVLVGFIGNTEEVTSLEGQKVAEELGMLYYETSPTTQETITPIFLEIVKTAVARGILNKVE